MQAPYVCTGTSYTWTELHQRASRKGTWQRSAKQQKSTLETTRRWPLCLIQTQCKLSGLKWLFSLSFSVFETVHACVRACGRAGGLCACV